MADTGAPQNDSQEHCSLPKDINPFEKEGEQTLPAKIIRSLVAAVKCKIKQLNTVISTSEGQDAVLGSIEYLSNALHHSLIYLKTHGASFISTDGPNKGPETSPMLILSSLVSDARYTLRLLGVIRLLNLDLSIDKGSSSNLGTRMLSCLQICMLLMYQASENVFYLARKGIISQSFLERYSRIRKWSLWSARFLLGYFSLQFIKLWRDWTLSTGSESDSLKYSMKKPDEEQTDENKIEYGTVLEGHEWWKSLVNTTIWTSLCVHWSLERGIGFPDKFCGLSAFVAGAWGLHDMFKEARGTSLL